MNSMKRLLLLASSVALVAGCATTQGASTREGAPKESAVAQQKVDPRTMSFPPLKFEIPKSERVQLKNGMIVYLLQDHELPIVNLTAYLNAGSIYDPPGKVGLAALTGAALRSGGTLDTPPDKLDRELEEVTERLEAAFELNTPPRPKDVRREAELKALIKALATDGHK